MCVAKVRLPGGRQGRGRLPLPLPPFLYIYVSRYSSPTASNRRAIADPPPPENGEGGGGARAGDPTLGGCSSCRGLLLIVQ